MPVSKKEFSKLKKGGGEYKRRIRQLREHLEDLSAGNSASLLTAFLESKKQGKLRQQLDINNDKLEKLLSYLKHNHANEENYQKRRWISLLTPIFTRKELVNRGFKVSKESFAKARKLTKALVPGTRVIETRGRPIKATENLRQSIEQFLKRNSYPAANRTVKKNKKIIPVRYVKAGFKALFAKFASETKSTVKYTTFRDNVPKYFKKARKSTDMCGVCVHGKNLQGKLQNIREAVHRNCLNCTCDSNCPIEQHCAQLPDILSLSEQIKLFNEHRALKSNQRNSFKEQFENLDDGEVLLVIDFKANIKLNIESPQVSKSFFNQPQRTLFGVAMAYKCPTTHEISKFYYDIFSEFLSHNAFFVQSALQKVFRDPFFKKLNVKRVNIWMDNANHFKNKELHRYLSDFVSEHKFDFIHANYFAEYHGKSWCDSRFSLISRLMKNATQVEGFAVRSTTDYIELLSSELERIAEGSETLNSTQLLIELDFQLPPVKSSLAKYDNIKCYQLFKFVGDKIDRHFSTNDHEVDEYTVRHCQVLRQSQVGKRGSSDVVVTEQDIAEFFTQQRRRSKFIESKRNGTLRRQIPKATRQTPLLQNPVSVSASTEGSDLVELPLESQEIFESQSSQVTERSNTYTLRSASGVSKRKHRDNDFIFTDDHVGVEISVSRPLKRRRIITDSESCPTFVVCPTDTSTPMECDLSSSQAHLLSTIDPVTQTTSTSLCDIMDTSVSEFSECQPMEIERWAKGVAGLVALGSERNDSAVM